MKRKCNHCKEWKDVEEFAWRWKALGKRQKACRECMAKFNKASYQKQTKKDKRRIYKNRDRRAQEAKQYVWDYLSSHPCVKCGESDPRLLEFHHRNPKTKKYNIANITSGRHSIATIRKEISKCDVLCVRCHRKSTYDERGWFRG